MRFTCGVDEAGRGPLAGPVFAAAVILDPDNPIIGLDDSKKLSEKKRDKLFIEIKEKALAWCISSASVEEIDEINILQASLLAMKRAVEGLQAKATLALIDGNKCPVMDTPAQAIIGGDGIEKCIGAASILAKVARDAYCLEMHKKNPEYEFDKHKGYGTALHMAALNKYGPADCHRKTFAPVTKLLGGNFVASRSELICK